MCCGINASLPKLVIIILQADNKMSRARLVSKVLNEEEMRMALDALDVGGQLPPRWQVRVNFYFILTNNIILYLIYKFILYYITVISAI